MAWLLSDWFIPPHQQIQGSQEVVPCMTQYETAYLQEVSQPVAIWGRIQTGGGLVPHATKAEALGGEGEPQPLTDVLARTGVGETYTAGFQISNCPGRAGLSFKKSGEFPDGERE
jgi:hypothetical protein